MQRSVACMASATSSLTRTRPPTSARRRCRSCPVLVSSTPGRTAHTSRLERVAHHATTGGRRAGPRSDPGGDALKAGKAAMAKGSAVCVCVGARQLIHQSVGTLVRESAKRAGKNADVVWRDRRGDTGEVAESSASRTAVEIAETAVFSFSSRFLTMRRKTSAAANWPLVGVGLCRGRRDLHLHQATLLELCVLCPPGRGWLPIRTWSWRGRLARSPQPTGEIADTAWRDRRRRLARSSRPVGEIAETAPRTRLDRLDRLARSPTPPGEIAETAEGGWRDRRDRASNGWRDCRDRLARSPKPAGEIVDSNAPRTRLGRLDSPLLCEQVERHVLQRRHWSIASSRRPRVIASSRRGNSNRCGVGCSRWRRVLLDLGG